VSGLYASIGSFAADAGPAILMIAAFALAIGGVSLIRKGNRQKGWLMIVCAVVFIGNVAILKA
jgi:hypothetical protein